MTLNELSFGQSAVVTALADPCQGLVRRRLLDLGMTPGAVIQAERANAGRSAVAYRVRGTLIAIRQEQAGQIMVQPL